MSRTEIGAWFRRSSMVEANSPGGGLRAAIREVLLSTNSRTHSRFGGGIRPRLGDDGPGTARCGRVDWSSGVVEQSGVAPP